MKLEYVGAMPVISQNGVGFDHSKPDKYTFLNAIAELLEALDFGASKTTHHLHNVGDTAYNSVQLFEVLKKYCSNLDEVNKLRQEKTEDLIDDLIKRVEDNRNLNEDERTAWLNNINLMRDYYMQFVTNEAAYNCALSALGQEVHDAKIQEVTFPMARNYGSVLHDLDYVMQNRKPPIDSVLTIEIKNDTLVGKFTITHR